MCLPTPLHCSLLNASGSAVCELVVTAHGRAAQCSVKEDDYEDDVTLMWDSGGEMLDLAEGGHRLLPPPQSCAAAHRNCRHD